MDYNNNIPLITLTTDWGQHDYYIGMLKGKIISQISNLSIIDLTHDIPSFNIHNAAFILKNSFEYFPKGSIHLVLVNSEACIIPRLLVIKYLEHFFVVPDNGIIGFLFNQIPEEVYGIEFQPEGGFASLNAYVKAIELLYKNQITNNGTLKVSDFDKKIALRATIDDSIITGSIIYIDSFKNAITNISRSLFERVGKGRNYNIYVQSNHNKISKLSTNYNEVESGELLGIFNSANLLEIAIRNGYAAELLSLRIGGSVRINFG